MIPILVPLFVGAFRRADELATAMEARCYRGGEGRTSLKKLTFVLKDYITFLLMVLLLSALVLIKIYL
jgi:energy-coupling factor transport system permease protein